MCLQLCVPWWGIHPIVFILAMNSLPKSAALLNTIRVEFRYWPKASPFLEVWLLLFRFFFFKCTWTHLLHVLLVAIRADTKNLHPWNNILCYITFYAENHSFACREWLSVFATIFLALSRSTSSVVEWEAETYLMLTVLVILLYCLTQLCFMGAVIMLG